MGSIQQSGQIVTVVMTVTFTISVEAMCSVSYSRRAMVGLQVNNDLHEGFSGPDQGF